jgi:hypothetical protein
MLSTCCRTEFVQKCPSELIYILLALRKFSFNYLSCVIINVLIIYCHISQISNGKTVIGKANEMRWKLFFWDVKMSSLVHLHLKHAVTIFRAEDRRELIHYENGSVHFSDCSTFIQKSVKFYQTTQRHIQDDSTFQSLLPEPHILQDTISFIKFIFDQTWMIFKVLK